jgi:hypothetical protein
MRERREMREAVARSLVLPSGLRPRRSGLSGGSPVPMRGIRGASPVTAVVCGDTIADRGS